MELVLTTGRMELVLDCRFPYTYPTLCCEESCIYPNQGFFPLNLCPKCQYQCQRGVLGDTSRTSPLQGHLTELKVTVCQTPELENFAAASRSRCQQNSSSSSSTVEFVDDTYTTVDESWLFTTMRIRKYTRAREITHYVGEIGSVTTVTDDFAKSTLTGKDLYSRRIDDTCLCRRRRRKQSSPADKRL